MEDANKHLSKSWVEKTTKEAMGEFKKWDKHKQKKWVDEYLEVSLKAYGVVLDNARETLNKINAIKDSAKTAIDGTEKIVESQRNNNEPLSDAARKWIEKSKATVEGSEQAVEDLISAFSDSSPMAGREDYFKKAVDAKALTKDDVDKIKAARKEGIDVGNEFGKSGPTMKRLEEYRKRWAILTAELDGFEKQRTGKVQEWAVAINKQLKEFADGQAKWDDDLRTTISKINRNLEGLLGKMEATDPKGFGSSLMKAIKVKLSSKAKEQAQQDLAGLHMYMKLLEDFLKTAKGTFKTRLTEFQSLTVSLKDAGPYAEPQRKTLAALGTKLAEQKKSIEELDATAKEAIATAKE